MLQMMLCGFAAIAALWPAFAAAEPIKLKLAFLLSDRTSAYVDMVKPFVDAVNGDARKEIQIDVYSSGVLGKSPAQQAQLVLDGTADIAFVIPGVTTLFPDNAVVELPGLFHGLREASVVFSRLVAAEALRGYGDFYVIGTFATEPESLHARRPIASLDDLRGQRIRASGPIEAAALAKLRMTPVIMPALAVSEAISSGAIDGAAIAPALLQEFGIGRIAPYHYLLRTSAGTLMLLMNRKAFEALPDTAKDTIRRYSGEWTAARFADGYEVTNAQVIEKLRSDPRRKVIVPTAAELETAQAAFRAVTEDWAAAEPHHRRLLELATREILKFRSTR
jgi:TRAP-type C4-dicarboxylate transport system substrate-binding protein